MTSETKTVPPKAQATATQPKTRPPLTTEQREQKNARDRERRATLAAAKSQKQTKQQQNQQINTDHSAAPQTTFEGTIAGQQAQRDRPFQKALGASLQAQDKARAARIRISQQNQPDRK